jgi:hypothetical protein
MLHVLYRELQVASKAESRIQNSESRMKHWFAWCISEYVHLRVYGFILDSEFWILLRQRLLKFLQIITEQRVT